METPHALIYIQKKKVGEKPLKKIVDCKCIKAFDINKWKTNSLFYKNKIVRVSDGNNKSTPGTVLFIGDSYDSVENFLKNSNKRLRIPKMRKSLLDSAIDDVEPVDTTELKEAKKKKKDLKSKGTLKRKSIEKRIIETYKENLEKRPEIQTQILEASTSCDRTLPLARSLTPVSDNFDKGTNNDSPSLSIIFKNQTNNYPMSALNTTPRRSSLISMKKSSMNDTNKSESNLIEIYNDIFQVKNKPEPTHSVTETNEYVTHIDKGVMCNTAAYKDAFKTLNPQKFFSILNEGIYGYMELSKRTIQKRNASDKLFSPVKKEVVEDEFFKFLKLKGFSSSQMKVELNKCNRYHRVSISSAKKKVKRLSNGGENNTENIDDDIQINYEK